MTATPSSPGRSLGARYWILIVAGFAIHAIATFFWMREGGFFERPPTQDAACYRLLAKVIVDQGGGEWGRMAAVAHSLPNDHHPPLYALALAAYSKAFSVELDGVGLWIPHVAFGLLLYLGCGMLVGRILHPKHHGLALILVLCAPGFIVFLRPSFSQMPMVALSLLAAGNLLASDGLVRLWRVAVAGVFAALAIFTKNLALLEVGAFAGAYLLMMLVRRRVPLPRLLGAAAVFLLPILLLNTAWYVANFHNVVRYASAIAGPSGQKTWSAAIPLWSVRRWVADPWYFCRFCIGMPVAIAAGAIIIAFAAKRVRSAGAPPLAASWRDPVGLASLLIATAISYVVMTIGQVHADAYFITQWIPVFAVVFAPLASELRGSGGVVLRGLLLLSALAMGALAYVSFREPDPLVEVAGWPIVDHFDSRGLALHARDAGCRPRPDVERWPVGRLVDAAAAWAGQPRALVGLISQDDVPPPYLVRVNVVFESMRRGLAVDESELILAGGQQPAEVLAAIAACDVLCVDRRFGPVEKVDALARGVGIRIEHLADLDVTDRWGFRLFGLRRKR